MGMISEFKDFAMKGNLVDMAVGFILGGAFGTLVTSMVNDIIMPVVGHFTGGADFSDLKVALSGEEGAATINYGLFINALIAFIILAWVLFLIIKGMNKAVKAKEEEPAAPPANEVLLAEIRDLLAKK